MDLCNEDRLRVAIALTILRNKPPNQSLSSYIVELKERFYPSILQSPSSSAPSNNLSDHTRTHSEWRKRVLALEQENDALKRQIQKQELDAMRMRMKLSPSKLNVNSTQPPKKKRKIVINNNNNNNISDLGPAMIESLDILTSLRLVQQDSSGANGQTIVLANIKRTLAGLGKLVHELVAQTSSVVPVSSRHNIAYCLQDLLVSVLESLLLAPQHSILPQILGELTISVIRPIICGFHPVSRRIFLSFKECNTKFDIRPNLLCSIKVLLDCLLQLKERTRDIREFTILQTVEEIASYWKISPHIQNELVHKEKSERLARKDSLWYHCSIIHLALDGFAQSSYADEKTQLLSSAVVDAIAGLPHVIEAHRPVDITAKNMVLAIVEKAWLNGCGATTHNT